MTTIISNGVDFIVNDTIITIFGKRTGLTTLDYIRLNNPLFLPIEASLKEIGIKNNITTVNILKETLLQAINFFNENNLIEEKIKEDINTLISFTYDDKEMFKFKYKNL